MAKPKPKWSLKKKLLVACGAVLAIPLAFILFLLIARIVSSVQHSVQTRAAKPKVATAKSKAEPIADQKVAQFESDLIATGLVASQIAASKVNSCYLDHQDAGWFATNWYQACYLRYVRGYNTTISKDKAKLIYAGSSQLVADFGNLSNLDKFYPSTCSLSDEFQGQAHVIYLPADAPRNADYSCVIPDQYRGTFTPTQIEKQYNAYQPIQTFDQNAISDAQNQLWFEYQTQYYHEDIGCGSFLCDSPRAKPAM